MNATPKQQHAYHTKYMAAMIASLQAELATHAEDAHENGTSYQHVEEIAEVVTDMERLLTRMSGFNQ